MPDLTPDPVPAPVPNPGIPDVQSVLAALAAKVADRDALRALADDLQKKLPAPGQVVLSPEQWDQLRGLAS